MQTLIKLMECMNMLKDKHYANERRAKLRPKVQKKERFQIQAIIDEFLLPGKIKAGTKITKYS